jgi:hypothetical protein
MILFIFTLTPHLDSFSGVIRLNVAVGLPQPCSRHVFPQNTLSPGYGLFEKIICSFSAPHSMLAGGGEALVIRWMEPALEEPRK